MLPGVKLRQQCGTDAGRGSWGCPSFCHWHWGKHVKKGGWESNKRKGEQKKIQEAV